MTYKKITEEDLKKTDKTELNNHINSVIYMLDQMITWYRILNRWRSKQSIVIGEYLKTVRFFYQRNLAIWVTTYLNLNRLGEAATGAEFGSYSLENITSCLSDFAIPPNYKPTTSLVVYALPETEIVNKHPYLTVSEYCTGEAIKSLKEWLAILQGWRNQAGKIAHKEFIRHFKRLSSSYGLELADNPEELHWFGIKEVYPRVHEKTFNEIVYKNKAKAADSFIKLRNRKWELRTEEWDLRVKSGDSIREWTINDG